MICAIDIGGTKTLVAVCKPDGTIISEQRFNTPQNYQAFLAELTKVYKGLSNKDLTVTSVAAPGNIDRNNGVGTIFGNLPWRNVPLKKDIASIFNTEVLLENDANLAGLSEATKLQPMPNKVLYITVSTGIGTGIITNGVLDPEFLDSEGGHMLFEHDGKLQIWESFASGKAITKKYGKQAAEINDTKAWQDIARNLAIGIVNLTSVIEPDIIIIGGGVGVHFAKYKDFLREQIDNITPAMVDKPPIVQAQMPEQAVINGCVVFAKQYEQHK